MDVEVQLGGPDFPPRKTFNSHHHKFVTAPLVEAEGEVVLTGGLRGDLRE